MKKTMILLVLATLVSSAAIAREPRVEPILGYQPDLQGITFQVLSGGCSRKDDFKARLVKTGDGIIQITLLRLNPDPCFAFLPIGDRFTLSYEEMGLERNERFTVMNPNGVAQTWMW